MTKTKNKGQARKAANIKKNGKQQKSYGVHKRLQSHTVPVMQRSQVPLLSKKQKKAGGSPASTQSVPPKEVKAGISSNIYGPAMRILLVGEGDFGFAAALALLWGDASGLTATVFDD